MTEKRFACEHDDYNLNLVDNEYNTFYLIDDFDENIRIFCKRLNELVDENEELDTKCSQLKEENEQLKQELSKLKKDCVKKAKKEIRKQREENAIRWANIGR